MDIYYYLKDRIEFSDIELEIQLDLSELKEGTYRLYSEGQKDRIFITDKSGRIVGTICGYNHYKEFIRNNPIYLSGSDLNLMIKKIVLSEEKKLNFIIVNNH